MLDILFRAYGNLDIKLKRYRLGANDMHTSAECFDSWFDTDSILFFVLNDLVQNTVSAGQLDVFDWAIANCDE